MMNEIRRIIQSELADRKAGVFEMLFLGSLVYDLALAFSKKINPDLFTPVSKWRDDPGWMERDRNPEKRALDWARYKRRLRNQENG